MAKREFQIENEYQYNRQGPVRWLVSHVLRYPILPLALVICAVANNFAYSSIHVFVGRAFDVIRLQGFEMAQVLLPVFGILGAAVGQGLAGILRNFSVEFWPRRSRKTHGRNCTPASWARARPSTAVSA